MRPLTVAFLKSVAPLAQPGRVSTPHLCAIRLDRLAQQHLIFAAVPAIEGLEKLEAVGIRINQRRDALAKGHPACPGLNAIRIHSKRRVLFRDSTIRRSNEGQVWCGAGNGLDPGREPGRARG